MTAARPRPAVRRGTPIHRHTMTLARADTAASHGPAHVAIVIVFIVDRDLAPRASAPTDRPLRGWWRVVP